MSQESVPVTSRPAMATRTKQGGASRLFLAASYAGLLAALLILGTAVAFALIQTNHAGRIYPSVSAAGIDVGGMTRDEATAALSGHVSELLDEPLVIRYGGMIWTPTLAQIGFSIDTNATIDAAFAVGREEQARDRLRAVARSYTDGSAVELTLTLDEQVLRTWFDTVDGDLGPPPHDASIVVTNGVVSIDPDVDGMVVDRDAAVALIRSEVSSLSPDKIDLPVVEKVATVRASDLEPARVTLESALSQPVIVTYQKKQWKIQPQDLGRFATISVTYDADGKPVVAPTFDQSLLAQWLEATLSSEVGRPAKSVSVIWGGNGVGAVANGDAVVGLELEAEKLAGLVIGSALGDHSSVTATVVTIEPDLTAADIPSLGITTYLGIGESNFDMSDEGRVENIKNGTRRLNGTLLAPGAEFSFNRAIGEIGPETGFVESLVIDGERVGRDYGGGICQVSTTVFRAVFFAGLPITEWNSHRYRIGFYEYDNWPPGLDASIMQPDGDPFGGDDFRFRNPSSDGWILIEAYTDGVYVYVKLYGPDLGYDVSISGPEMGDEVPPTEDVEVVDWKLDPGTMKQTEWAQPGLFVHFQRVVKDRDGNVIEDEPYDTYFFPRGNVWTVSEDMAGKSPAAEKEK